MRNNFRKRNRIFVILNFTLAYIKKNSIFITLGIFICWQLLAFLSETEKPEISEPSQYQILDERTRARLENVDEFIEDVIKNINFEEVDLVDLHYKNKWSELDIEIAFDLHKVNKRFGIGGKPMVYNDNFTFNEGMIEIMENEIKIEGFNEPLSQMISPNRTLADSRPYGCDLETYDQILPTMSLIIIFHNEPLSTMMRTVFSIINQTPKKLLKEIILVDDTSSYPDLVSGKLERYIVTQLPINLIRLIRIKNRAGLIKARMIGAHFACGDVLVFCDSHIEVESFWSEPLLQRIKWDRKVLISPVIKSIEPYYLSYDHNNGVFISGFNWNGWFDWIDIPPYENERKKHSWSSTRSPTSMGAFLAIDRKYFWEIGSFDPGMEIWGGENLELPFRIWMCGGSVEIHPCSRVGHLYRIIHTYKWTFGSNQTDTLLHNMARTAEVWLDEYKALFYQHYNYVEEEIDYGNISARIALRNRLNCKNFKWFLDNIYKEKFRGFMDSMMAGQFKSEYNGMCLDSLKQKPEYDLGLLDCFKFYPGPTQILYLTANKVLRLDDSGCLNTDSTNENQIKVLKCSNLNLDQMERWSYDSSTRQIVNLKYKKCISISNSSLILENCLIKRNQKWAFIPLVRAKKANL